MIQQQNYFTPFYHSIKHYELPERFTFPFCYEPHPLCLLAAQELQEKLELTKEFQQEFERVGKMFGVLIVENQQGEVGFLSAFSGKLVNKQSNITFVPPVFDIEIEGEFFSVESKVINQLNDELEQLIANPEIEKVRLKVADMVKLQDEQLDQQRDLMTTNRANRKARREQVRVHCVNDELASKLQQLASESIADKNKLRDLKLHWHELITNEQQKLTSLTDEVNTIKNTRKKLSTKLQKKLFKQYRLLNIAGVEKNLMELFQQERYSIPPAGTGDCAAPKLLQFAFKNNMKPLAMAEFWWGKAPKSEIRQHKRFYGACSGKCQPILAHMLQGMNIDDNPLLVNPAEGKDLEIIYQDNDIVVVNKPSEFLSVPGKNIEDSVYLRIKEQFPQAEGSLIVHRLDMSTSGIMVLALSKRSQKHLQQQFVQRTIKKRYVATLEGDIEKLLKTNSGEINLPLRGDLDDRPRQLVCFEHGKPSKTQWQIINTLDGKSKLFLYPETGRTHQLRVHCAHPKGLSLPILGDDLYGNMIKGSDCDTNSNSKKIQRLHLHAQMLTLVHPISKEVMTFQVDENF